MDQIFNKKKKREEEENEQSNASKEEFFPTSQFFKVQSQFFRFMG